MFAIVCLDGVGITMIGYSRWQEVAVVVRGKEGLAKLREGKWKRTGNF
jgi:hypothetical protein